MSLPRIVFVALLPSLLLVACTTGSGAPAAVQGSSSPTAPANVAILSREPTTPPQPLPPESPTPTNAPVPAPAVTATPQRQAATVVRVIDGDTIEAEIAGKRETVRLIGFDTPEKFTTRTGYVECFGQEASQYAEKLLPPGAKVQIAQDPTQDTRDRNGRLLAHVWLPDGRLFGEVMLRDGYALEFTFERPSQFQQVYKAAEAEAKAQGRGLWPESACGGQRKPLGGGPTTTATAGAATPTHTVTPRPGGSSMTATPRAAATPTTEATRGNCSPAYPDVCIPPPPPDLDCPDIRRMGYRNIRVLPPDPHRLDGDGDGRGCE